MHCQAPPNDWFTAVHHREMPDRIKAGESDAGIVWKTEGLEAVRAGSNIETAALPDKDSLRKDVSYVVGVLKASSHKPAAESFLAYLRSSDGQEAHARFGFVRASGGELKMRPID
ncbi:MAG: extracellular solute-binding protein [Rhizobiales bacterium]|nr:extracellular solute-binding protein [Hyphomicrobiales bacterium]